MPKRQQEDAAAGFRASAFIHHSSFVIRHLVMPYLDQFLNVVVQQGGSDLHISEGQPPKMRRHGDIMPIRTEPVSHDEGVRMLSEICGARNWELFDERGDLDFAYEMDQASRF